MPDVGLDFTLENPAGGNKSDFSVILIYTCIRGVLVKHPSLHCQRNHILLTGLAAESKFKTCHEARGEEGKSLPLERAIKGSRADLILTEHGAACHQLSKDI